jgi:hypothetical protein
MTVTKNTHHRNLLRFCLASIIQLRFEANDTHAKQISLRRSNTYSTYSPLWADVDIYDSATWITIMTTTPPARQRMMMTLQSIMMMVCATSSPGWTSAHVGVAASPTLLMSVSLLSLCGCLYVIATYLYVRPALRQHPNGIMFGMSCYGAMYHLLYVIESIHLASSSSSPTTLPLPMTKATTTLMACHQSIPPYIVHFFLTGQETYMLIFAFDLLLALKNPFMIAKGQMKTYHAAGFLWRCGTSLYLYDIYPCFRDVVP